LAGWTGSITSSSSEMVDSPSVVLEYAAGGSLATGWRRLPAVRDFRRPRWPGLAGNCWRRGAAFMLMSHPPGSQALQRPVRGRGSADRFRRGSQRRACSRTTRWMDREAVGRFRIAHRSSSRTGEGSTPRSTCSAREHPSTDDRGPSPFSGGTNRAASSPPMLGRRGAPPSSRAPGLPWCSRRSS
jgi:hypothetical protein